ncbi:MAG: ATP-binding cassette domain-containing protein [Clostridiales bacterium]|nr:ATP-binding cassette domain-containing protein [Clostridiales bacterium]
MTNGQAAGLLQTEDLKQHFLIPTGFLKSKTIRAVDGVSFSIRSGETLGLVGESGCGKTTVGRTLLYLYKPTGGRIHFDGKEIRSEESIREMRKKASIVFQDPYSSLNPRMTVEDIIAEPLDIHQIVKTKQERSHRVRELLDAVELPHEHAGRYIHEFSGGQRQRIGIARALAMGPKFIVCDEPVSALDVSIQAQIINMFEDLQAELGLAYLFIAHNLNVVRHISKRIMVMYLGKVVESAPAAALCDSPMHPYTKSLLSAVPIPDPHKERSRTRIVLEGDVPSPMDLPGGCNFRTRCPEATSRCAEAAPPLTGCGTDRQAACWYI